MGFLVREILATLAGSELYSLQHQLQCGPPTPALDPFCMPHHPTIQYNTMNISTAPLCLYAGWVYRGDRGPYLSHAYLAYPSALLPIPTTGRPPFCSRRMHRPIIDMRKARERDVLQVLLCRV